ncbi:Cytidylate kinase [Anaerococcus prevotii]|uniref:Cytidylate kinase n=1 Tax=Anaerococcus prevotii (strain ATCC 9321 / DSM 20548 / JCM 6508 / NCTC 11806 / PC1) TaxID=525919 RepID=C7RHT8_ANAPD|nr:(d)CMP kinase [Anaerococcus prevotii]ACV29049.1 cytidylate kinase [Anaerococcus prevotii DSM 20548]SUU94722.1 Cytidylate kinase [Anaerococcus prevotii]
MTYIIALDGPSGSGKSTIAQKLSDRLGIEYLNTGSMYRAVTKYFLDNEIKEIDLDKIIKNLENIQIDFNEGAIFLNGDDVSKEIRSDIVTKNVSWVSANEDVRRKLVDMQRQIAQNTSFILDGRDIGTVVFPNAKYKFFLTASPRVRAMRRFEQNESSLSLDELEKSIIARDEYDSSRETSPLRKAEDAHLIDNSDLNIEETIEAILNMMDGEDVI